MSGDVNVPVTEEVTGKGPKRELRLTCWGCSESEKLVGAEQITENYLPWYRRHRRCIENWRKEHK